jgi:hypothetical protein
MKEQVQLKTGTAKKQFLYKTARRSQWSKVLACLLVITILATSIMAYNLHEYNNAINSYYYTVTKLQMVTNNIRQMEDKFDKSLNKNIAQSKKSEANQAIQDVKQTKTRLQINAVSHHKQQTGEIYQQIAETENYIILLNSYLENLKYKIFQNTE